MDGWMDGFIAGVKREPRPRPAATARDGDTPSCILFRPTQETVTAFGTATARTNLIAECVRIALALLLLLCRLSC